MNRFLAVLLASTLAACALARTAPAGPSPILVAGDALAHAAGTAPQSVATSLRFYWTIGSNTIRLPQVNGTVLLSINSTGTLRAEGLDAAGNVVPLSDPVWTGSGTWFTVVGAGLSAMVTPIAVGPYDPALLNADADSGPGVTPIWGFVQIRVVD